MVYNLRKMLTSIFKYYTYNILYEPNKKNIFYIKRIECVQRECFSHKDELLSIVLGCLYAFDTVTCFASDYKG